MLRKILGLLRKFLDFAHDQDWIDDKANKPVIDKKCKKDKELH